MTKLPIIKKDTKRNRFICWLSGHLTIKSHEFSEIVICDRCGRKIKAWYDFMNCGYDLV